MGASSPQTTVRSGADLEILLLVKNNLHWNYAVPTHRIIVAVANGWVTIAGEVDHAYQSRCAEQAARAAPGVLGVDNKITVSPRAEGRRAAGEEHTPASEK